MFFLICCIVAVTAVDVALLYSDSGRSPSVLDVVAKLNASQLSVKEFAVNLGTPTLAELQNASRSVIVYSGFPFASGVLLGNVLADFVDAGGNVVVMYSALITYRSLHVAGRFETAGMHPVLSSSFVYNDGPRTMIKVAPSHALLDGVSSFDGGPYSYRPSVTTLTAGAVLIANWSTGEPLVVAIEPRTKFNGSIVSLGFSPQSSDADNRFWNSSTDGARLMANAVRFWQPKANTATLPPFETPGATTTTRSTLGTTTDTTDGMSETLTNATSAGAVPAETVVSAPDGGVIGGAVGGAVAGLGLLILVAVCVARVRSRKRDQPVLPADATYGDASSVRMPVPSNKDFYSDAHSVRDSYADASDVRK